MGRQRYDHESDRGLDHARGIVSPGPRWRRGGDVARRCEEGRRPSRKEVSWILQGNSSGDLAQIKGDPVSLGGLSQSVACRATRSAGSICSDVAAELRLGCGHVAVLGVVVFGPLAAAKGSCAAA